jgi:hypothetical protein
MKPLNLERYLELCDTFFKIDLFHVDPGLLPEESSEPGIAALITNGAAFVPRLYRLDYAARLHDNLPATMIRGQSDRGEIAAFLEPFCAPVYQHHPGSTKTDVRRQLHRFLAVVSNLYRSFTSEKKRRSIDVPIVTDTPPLAFFQSNGEMGPYTLTSEMVQRELGTATSVVSLPQSCRDDPIIWSSLTHEVCGHDIVHADEQLVPELVEGIRALFCPRGFDPDPLPEGDEPNAAIRSPEGDDLNALIWSYWIDEAVADVYGILNMGPTVPLNLSAFLYAFVGRFAVKNGGRALPAGSLRTSSGPGDDGRMDNHPTDILRLYLAIGVIESLSRLSSAKKHHYIEDIKAVAKLAAKGETTVRLTGAVQISHDNWLDIDVKVPLADAQDGARRAGAFMATTRLQALGNHSVQDIETWDDADEKTASDVAGRLGRKESIVGVGDDAQLLAGATMAVLARRGSYASATDLLNAALDDSYINDPIWQGLSFDLMVALDCLAAGKRKPGAARKNKPGGRKSGPARQKKSSKR